MGRLRGEVSKEKHPSLTGVFAVYETLLVRIVSTTTDSVNVLADDLMIPALAGKRFVAHGFDTGCLTLFSDSGAYAAGLTAEDTSLLYQVRLLTFKFNWSRM